MNVISEHQGKGAQGCCGYGDLLHISLADLHPDTFLYCVRPRSQRSFKINLITQRLHEYVLTVEIKGESSVAPPVPIPIYYHCGCAALQTFPVYLDTEYKALAGWGGCSCCSWRLCKYESDAFLLFRGELYILYLFTTYYAFPWCWAVWLILDSTPVALCNHKHLSL